jgi:hypothetical protein
MQLNLKAFAITCGVLWATIFFFVAVANQIWIGYGDAFLKVVASVYPGYHAGKSMLDLIVGVVYAVIDGIVGGFVFAWCYNFAIQKSDLKKGWHRKADQ